MLPSWFGGPVGTEASGDARGKSQPGSKSKSKPTPKGPRKTTEIEPRANMEGPSVSACGAPGRHDTHTVLEAKAP